MREQCVPCKYVRLVKEMYRGAMTQVRSSVGMAKEFPVIVGLHQGSALSPYLFDLIMDVLVKDVKKEAPWNMMFADDVVLCEQNIDRFEEKLEDWRKALEESGMKIRWTKSEYLALKDVQMRSCKIQDDEPKSGYCPRSSTSRSRESATLQKRVFRYQPPECAEERGRGSARR
ncbi:uncharacterized protein LOC124606081 [Schistocerca americana]|uniref:uncharacterized protein LOC124606081 n=1 Tax=Schistocerca americana TaxID=7009 RepID=UPI001F4FCDB1|nr:uncharacterized protein LOC124606081 [Schistocerca americana]